MDHFVFFFFILIAFTTTTITTLEFQDFTPCDGGVAGNHVRISLSTSIDYDRSQSNPKLLLRLEMGIGSDCQEHTNLGFSDSIEEAYLLIRNSGMKYLNVTIDDIASIIVTISHIMGGLLGLGLLYDDDDDDAAALGLLFETPEQLQLQTENVASYCVPHKKFIGNKPFLRIRIPSLDAYTFGQGTMTSQLSQHTSDMDISPSPYQGCDDEYDYDLPTKLYVQTPEQLQTENVASYCVPHKKFIGNRPSLRIRIPSLDTYTFGQETCTSPDMEISSYRSGDGESGYKFVQDVDPKTTFFSEVLRRWRLSEIEGNFDNILSQYKALCVPIIQHKQSATVWPGRRDIKVKALQAARAAKRREEENEKKRKMKKEAFKIAIERSKKQKEKDDRKQMAKKKACLYQMR